MQKKNTVIKDYILSSQKRVLIEKQKSDQIIFLEKAQYHSLLTQNKDYVFLFLLRK